MAEKATLIDVSKCIACRSCQVACKQWNKLPAVATNNLGTYENPPSLSVDTWTLVKFREVRFNGDFKWLFRKHQCMHCTNAACVKLCPSDAIYKDAETGFVLINEARCIGCGVCEKFCPFEVPHVDLEACDAKKCRFCIDRVMDGKEPACAKACPTGAIKFGDRDMLVAEARSIADAKGWYLYGDSELGGLHVLYLLPQSPQAYDLPRDPVSPNPFEAYAHLDEVYYSSPHRETVLAAAGLKYFGKVHTA